MKQNEMDKRDNIKKDSSGDSADCKTYTPNRTRNRNRSRKTEKRDQRVESSKLRSNSRAKLEGANDPAWYITSAEMAQSAANFSYATTAGLPFKPIDVSAFAGTSDNLVNSIPGIWTFDLVTCPGPSVDYTSAVNMAATHIYSWVRHANSGAKVYESADLMQYINAVTSCYVLYADLCRIYGLINHFNARSRYTPQALVTALGYDYEDLVSKQPQLLSLINTFALKLNQFAIPDMFSFVKRQLWLFGNVFTDRADDSKAQFYAFRWANLWKYSPIAEKTGGILEQYYIRKQDGTSPENDKSTLANIQSMINTLVNALQFNEDIGIMSGDVRKAYDPSTLIELPQLPLDYAIAPYYDEEALAQIENMTIGVSFNGNRNITQENGVIIYNPYVDTVAPLYDAATSIRMPFDNPTILDNIVATRLRTCYKNVSSTATPRYEIYASGTEICVGSVIRNLDGDYYSMPIRRMTTIKLVSDINEMSSIMYVDQFHHHPLIVFVEASGNGNIIAYSGEFNQYTYPVPSDIIANLHNMALLAEYAVPAVGMTKSK